MTQGSAAARGGTAAPTAACAHSGAELDRCGCAISASSECEPTTGRRRGRRQPGGVAVLRLLGEASGNGASTSVALATSIGAAQPRPRHAPSEGAQAAGSEVASPSPCGAGGACRCRAALRRLGRRAHRVMPLRQRESRKGW